MVLTQLFGKYLKTNIRLFLKEVNDTQSLFDVFNSKQRYNIKKTEIAFRAFQKN